MKMNVLLICPYHDDLPLLQNEAETLVNILEPRRTLIDNVTEARLRDTIAADVEKDGPFQGVWLATHASKDAIQLTDGELDHDALVRYVEETGASWIVINGCEAGGFGDSLRAIGVDVLAAAETTGSVGIEDRHAWRLTRPLAKALVEYDGDLEAAYNSVPQSAKYHRFFRAGATQTRTYGNSDRGLAVQVARIEEKLDNLTGEVADIKTALKERPTGAQVVGVVFFSSVIVLFVVALAAVLVTYIYQRGML